MRIDDEVKKDGELDKEQVQDAEIVEEKAEKVEEKVGLTKEVSQEAKMARLDNFQSVGQIMDYAEVLIKSKLVPSAFNTPEKVVAAIQQGRELGFGAVTALNNIHVIKGKATLSVHAIGALLKKAGIKYKILKDYEDHIKYSEDDTKKEIGRTKITTIRFYEKFGNEVIFNDISYTWAEASLAGLTTKENWIKMPKLMLRTRCLSIGARFVAPDALLGMYETSEMAEVENVDINIDEEGNVVNK